MAKRKLLLAVRKRPKTATGLGLGLGLLAVAAGVASGRPDLVRVALLFLGVGQ